MKENEKINWEPAHIKDGRFGEWLREIKDWAISRERYWGTPMPIWKCDECDEVKVVGSLNELKENTKKSGNQYILMRHGESDSNVGAFVSSKAENGDHLVVTPERAILYDPDEDVILDVVPVQVQPVQEGTATQ